MDGHSRSELQLLSIGKTCFELSRIHGTEDTIAHSKKYGDVSGINEVEPVSNKCDWITDLNSGPYYFTFKQVGQGGVLLGNGEAGLFI